MNMCTNINRSATIWVIRIRIHANPTALGGSLPIFWCFYRLPTSETFLPIFFFLFNSTLRYGRVHNVTTLPLLGEFKQSETHVPHSIYPDLIIGYLYTYAPRAGPGVKRIGLQQR